MDHVAAAVVGALVTIGLGFCVGPLIKQAVPDLQKPRSLSDDEWSALTSHPGAGRWIGFFEQLLFFGAFAVGKYEIIAGWLAFKLAAKWEAWKNIVQVPTDIGGISPLTWYEVRKAFGSWILSRFLLGTLLNILVGATGGAFALQLPALVRWFCS